MFLPLLQKVFPSLAAARPNNLFYFEQNREQQDVSRSTTQHILNQVEQPSLLERHQQGFYDCLFGKSPTSNGADELSALVAGQVEQLLLNPADILEHLPILPASLSNIIETLDNQDFAVKQLLKLIELEPVIAAKVIELANSSYYKHHDRTIDDLKNAFLVLGTKGLIEGVINGFIGKMAPQSKLYFRQYGQRIWHHSFSTGVITKLLLEQSDHADDMAKGYLVGLLANLGDMVVYQLMVDAFAYVHPDNQPDSKAFKQLLIKHTKRLTWQMAKHWQFPTSIVDALKWQMDIVDNDLLLSAYELAPLAACVYEANLLSEFELRMSEPLYAPSDEQTQNLLQSERAKEYWLAVSS